MPAVYCTLKLYVPRFTVPLDVIAPSGAMLNRPACAPERLYEPLSPAPSLVVAKNSVLVRAFSAIVRLCVSSAERTAVD